MTKIATWNVNSLKVRLPHVLDWMQQHHPDILALQELKQQDSDFPFDAFKDIGYHAICNGQKTYNGVAILSKHPAKDILKDIPDMDDPQRRILIATIDNIRIINLYVPNGESVESEKYQYKLNWLKRITNFIEDELKQYPNLVVLGDFNIAPEDRDVHEPLLWQGHVLCSQQERDALQKLLKLGLQDSFRLFEQPDKSFTWWDYRMLAFRRNHGLRIDHILLSEALASKCVSCVIDKAPRKLERPSDHAPVMVTIKM